MVIVIAAVGKKGELPVRWLGFLGCGFGHICG